MTFVPASVGSGRLVRALAGGSALLGVATLMLATAAGWPAQQSLLYAVAVPLAASTGAAFVLAAAFAGSALHMSDRVARGRFALPVTAAAAGCVLASLWLVAPLGLDDAANPAPRAAAPRVLDVPSAQVAVAPGRTPQQTTAGPRAHAEPGAPVLGGGRKPATATGAPTIRPAGPPTVTVGAAPAAPAAPPTRGRPAPGDGIDRAGVDPPAPPPEPTDDDVAPGAGKARSKKPTVLPGKRCGQRADHCGTPLGRGAGQRR